MIKTNVTQPYLPPLEEFIPFLEDIWETKCLTNNGKYHRAFESELASYLNVPYVSLFANGTLALVTALQTLRIIGEVITTPYSFVATTHALHWNNITPVFVDIENQYFNIDPKKIEAAITPKTSAIVPVHVYGNPCNVEAIQEIADNYGLKVIYDAAHAMGVKYKNNSILNYGDLSILSFHATKVFHTFEGGAIISHDIKTKKRIDSLKNFGILDETTVIAPGINAKMNEFQAALGLVQLKHFEEQIYKRKEIYKTYSAAIERIIGLTYLKAFSEDYYNYAYFPVLIDEKKYGIARDVLYEKFKKEGIFCRRYFYPLISSFPTYRGLPSSKYNNLVNANKVADEVLCLPIYSNLENAIVEKVNYLLEKYSNE